MIWKIYKKFLKICVQQIPVNRLRIFLLRKSGYKIGKQVFIGEALMIVDELEDKGQVIIGDRVSIAPRVTLIVSSHPSFSNIKPFAPVKKGTIIIEDDAWIGAGAIILPKITIGEGTIVGAGAVVTKDVLSHTIVVGVPAKVLRRNKSHSKLGSIKN